jgi:hypothetical protein
MRPLFAVAAVAFTLLQPNTIYLSDLLYTEIPFALITVVFVLVAVERPFSPANGCSRPAAGQGSEEDGPQGRGYRAWRPWIREAVSFMVAAAGFLLRTLGIALLAAWVLEAVVRRRWRLALARALLAILPIIAWQAYVVRVSHSYEYMHPAYAYQRAPYQAWNVTYAESLRWLMNSSHRDSRHMRPMSLTKRLQENTRRLIESTGEAISPTGVVPAFVLLALAVVGLAMLVRRRAWMMVFIVLTSLAIIWPWPWPDQFYRFLLPLSPFLLIGIAMAFDALWAVISALPVHPVIAAFARAALTVPVALALIPQVSSVQKLFRHRAVEGASYVPGRGDVGPHFFYYSKVLRARDVEIAWIQSHSNPNAIVAMHWPQICYLRTGRRAVLPPEERNQDRVRELLESVPISYVILELRDWMPAVEKDNRRWRLVESIDQVKLYERTSDVE